MKLSLSRVCKLHKLLDASDLLLSFFPLDGLGVNMLLCHGILKVLLLEVLVTVRKVVTSVTLYMNIIKLAEVKIPHIDLARGNHLTS